MRNKTLKRLDPTTNPLIGGCILPILILGAAIVTHVVILWVLAIPGVLFWSIPIAASWITRKKVNWTIMPKIVGFVLILPLGIFVGILALMGTGGGGSASQQTRRRISPNDTILGNGGNCTVYQRPDGSRYALDRQGRGGEGNTPILGPAEFDSR